MNFWTFIFNQIFAFQTLIFNISIYPYEINFFPHLKMNSLFRTSFLFLLTFVEVSSHEQFHGFFKAIGSMNDPELAFALNKIYNKSRLQCSSECLKHESCYYFDFCKIGSSSSCYIYNNNVTNTSAVESGACKRFGLVSVILLSLLNIPNSSYKQYE